MKPTLLALAAGMGSRYGGLKQMDGLGPNGETIMDYSIFDAARAGFGKVVFVIRKNFEKDFKDIFANRFKGAIEVDFVYQEVENVPQGTSYNAERIKPWGTGHAVLMGAPVIREPFAVINADDFYGADTFNVLNSFLSKNETNTNRYAMVGYRLGNTLSESGPVSRGICSVNENGILETVVERTQIERSGGIIFYKDGTTKVDIPENEPVSMNCWGFTPDFFTHLEKLFKEFLNHNGQNTTSEFYIPFAVNDLIKNKKVEVEVLQTTAKWFGVTYQDDRNSAILSINNLIKRGEYPAKLWV
ncbi:MAG: nucleotidyltransferase [Prevotellaceae bacterium]|jgi:UTP-glucose-1-phosphate uridylyltransferase|nr:nucleotidyltransferase [Prevotellaceae bacterium]